nr:hypothetical protein [Streptomyces sp. H34-AA3]
MGAALGEHSGGRVMPLLTGLENLVLGSVLDLAAPEAMWEPTARTPPLAGALAAGCPGRADAAFDLALTGFLACARTLLGDGGAGAARRPLPLPARAG